MSDNRLSKSDDMPPELPILQFSLRRMFLFVTAAGILLALMSIPTGIGKLAIPLIVAVVVLHVASTMLGSRLRALADDRRRWEEAHGIVDGEVLSAAGLAPRRLSAETPLGARSSIPGWSRRRLFAGAVVGGIAGAIVLAATIGYRTSWLGIAMGAISTAILGAWLVFLGGSFWWIVRHTWREALAHQRQDEARRRSVCRGDGDGI